MEKRRAGDVFVAGRYPELTYNPRDTRRQEIELRHYLEDSGKALTISGPSKSGKTVLLEHNLPPHEAIWINGADLAGSEDIYRRIIDWLGIFDMLEVQEQSGKTGGGKISAALKIPGGTGVAYEGSLGASSGDGIKRSRTRPIADVALEGLQQLPVPVIIDDFHYVPDGAKLEIVRAVKALILKTHVILIAVPQDAFDAVRQEPDMNGRIWTLRIEPWEPAELQEIARAGFDVLGVVDHGSTVGATLAEASMGAPFLMQQLCLDYLLDQGVLFTQEPSIDLAETADWESFFTRVADRSVPGVFDLLVRGPRTHGQKRSARSLRDGSATTDIYGAILLALAKLGRVYSVEYGTLTHKIDELFSNSPDSQRVTSSLGHLSTIAFENRGASDQALEYKDDRLHILDPFLSFYLQHGSWSLPAPPEKS